MKFLPWAGLTTAVEGEFIGLLSFTLQKEAMLGFVMLVQQCFTDDFLELTFLVLVSFAGVLVNNCLLYLQASCASFVSGEVRDCQSFTQMVLHAGPWNQLCPSSSLFNDYFKLVSKMFVSMTSWLAFIHISLMLIFPFSHGRLLFFIS